MHGLLYHIKILINEWFILRAHILDILSTQVSALCIGEGRRKNSWKMFLVWVGAKYHLLWWHSLIPTAAKTKFILNTRPPQECSANYYTMCIIVCESWRKSHFYTIIIKGCTLGVCLCVLHTYLPMNVFVSHGLHLSVGTPVIELHSVWLEDSWSLWTVCLSLFLT